MRALPTALLLILALAGWGLAAWWADSPTLPGPGAVRVLDQGIVTSVVVMHRPWLEAHPGAETAVLAALADAYRFSRGDRAQADAWFTEAAGIAFDPAVLALAASVEPNLEADATIRTALNQDDLAGMEQAAAFMLEVGLLEEPAALGTMVAQP